MGMESLEFVYWGVWDGSGEVAFSVSFFGGMGCLDLRGGYALL